MRTNCFILADYPDPFVDASAWYNLMVNNTNTFLTELYNTVDSSCFHIPVAKVIAKPGTVKCEICGAFFLP